MFRQQRSDQPDRGRHEGLYRPTEDPRERGDYEGMTRETSLYTKASLHPMFTGALMLAAGLAAAQFVRGRSAQSERYGIAEEHYDPGM
jgi:hypothetical protein